MTPTRSNPTPTHQQGRYTKQTKLHKIKKSWMIKDRWVMTRPGPPSQFDIFLKLDKKAATVGLVTIHS